MKDFIFHESFPEASAAFEFEPSLFHHVRHLVLQSPDEWIWFHAAHEKNKKIVASLYVNVAPDVATTAVRSPFGTIECTADTPPEVLYEFLRFVEAALIKRNRSGLLIKNSPYAYAPATNALLSAFLPNLGYSVDAAELAACMSVNGSFIETISATEKQVLQKLRLTGLRCELLHPDQLEKVYSFIAEGHRLKGYQLSMPYDTLLASHKKFPDRYVLSGVFLEENLVAASVAVRVSSSVLYNFYMGHDLSYRKFSPVLLLLEALYQYCGDHRITLLDLGTSSVDGQPNFGLLAFKLRLGAVLSPKLTFRKMFKA